MSRLLRPDVKCPRCGKRPNLRIAEGEKDAARHQDPQVLKATVMCQACGLVYHIRAGAYHGAA